MGTYGYLIGSVGLLLVAVVATVLAVSLQRRRRQSKLAQAREQFRRRREWLEAVFVSKASELRKPRDMVWADCEFDDAVAYARDRDSGNLRALVGMTISFEAEEGGSMVDVEAVCSLRTATALFTYDGQNWSTEGQAIFNLNPQQTIRRYQHELEVIE